MTTIYDTLIHQLQSDDPSLRIQALQVLAMVEETRAIDSIMTLYKSDPDELVRKTAQWAGNLIWTAQQGGHSSENALHVASSPDSRLAVYDPSLDYKEKRILESLMVVPTSREQDMQNQQDLLRAEWERVNAINAKRQTSALPSVADGPIADLKLLDAGLSDEFRQYLEETD